MESARQEKSVFTENELVPSVNDHKKSKQDEEKFRDAVEMKKHEIAQQQENTKVAIAKYAKKAMAEVKKRYNEVRRKTDEAETVENEKYYKGKERKRQCAQYIRTELLDDQDCVGA